MSSTPATRAVAAVGDAESAREELAGALTHRAVTLPSLRVDAVSCAARDPRPLIDLGRCDVATARRLADVLRADVTGGES